MACNDKIENICIEPILAKCVDYTGDLGNNTKITKSCVNQHDVNEDLYSITDEIIDNSDTSDLGELCLTYPTIEGKILLKSVFGTHEQEICELKDKVQELENKNILDIDITNLGLDFLCLVDSCGNPITTLKELLQSLINKVCTP